MSIPATGEIGFNNIGQLLGLSQPYSMNNCYAVSTAYPNIPSSGEISFLNFIGYTGYTLACKCDLYLLISNVC
jgi:hypothetical protein